MERFLILGQLNVAVSGTYETLFTIPVRAEISYSPSIGVTPSAAVSNTQTSVTSIIVCNIGLEATFSMRLLPDSNATVDADEYNLFLLSPIGDNETIVLSLGLALSTGNILSVTADEADRISFTAMGVEIT